MLEADGIMKNRELIIPYMPDHATDPGIWIEDRFDKDTHSTSGRVVHSMVVRDPTDESGSACIFLRKDWKCALQVAADAAGLHSWQFKPFYCILHPLDFDDQGRLTLFETKELLDEKASCLRPSIEKQSLIKVFQPELEYLVGKRNYLNLLKKINREMPFS